MFTNQLNQSTNKSILSVSLLHTKSILTPYTVSGILERSVNRKSPNTLCIKAFKSAGPTRLELATSCVTGRRSNQTELRPRIYHFYYELATFPITSGRSNSAKGGQTN